MNNKLIVGLFFVLSLVYMGGNVSATLVGEQGGYINTTVNMIPSKNGTLSCYSDSINFTVWCSASPSVLNVLIGIPINMTPGFYSINILLDQAYSGTNGTYAVIMGQYITSLSFSVTTPIPPEEPPINKTNETKGIIKISLIGIATRGKMAIVRTTDVDGRAVLATVTITDPEGNAQVVETNSPVKGFGSFKIAEDSDIPVILIAFAEGYETGTYTINELKGEKLSKETEPEVNKTLSIQNIQPESLYNSVVNFTIISQEDGAIIEQATVIIYDPDGSYVTTKSDASGYAKFYAGKLGNYMIYATKTGFNPSQNYTTVSRSPRKELTIVIYPAGQITPTNEIYVGSEYDIILYSDGVKINDTLDGSLNFNTRSQAIKFISGQARYVFQQGDAGGLTILVPQSDSYNSYEKTYIITESDYTLIILVGIAIFFIVFIYFLIRRARGSKESLGVEPEEEEELSFTEPEG